MTRKMYWKIVINGFGFLEQFSIQIPRLKFIWGFIFFINKNWKRDLKIKRTNKIGMEIVKKKKGEKEIEYVKLF
jgi:hypothetical protein